MHDLSRYLNKWEFTDIRVAVIVRDWNFLYKSQIRNRHTKDEEHAHQNISQAYLQIFRELDELKWPFYVMTYEAIVNYKQDYLDQIMPFFGLEAPKLDDLVDGNCFYLKK